MDEEPVDKIKDQQCQSSSERINDDDPRLLRADRNMEILNDWLSALDMHANRSDERWVLMSLLKSARLNYLHLRRARLEDSPYVAWACRNLLELRVFARYISTQQTGWERFMHDFFIDFAQSMEAQKELARVVVPESVDDHDALIRNLQEKKKQQGFNETQYLVAANLAKETGLEASFKSINKICSKLVHPTSLSVLTIDMDAEFQSQRDVLVIAGGQFITELLEDILPVAEKLIRVSSGESKSAEQWWQKNYDF